jgi:L-ascorbate metabolism protein UlaG (beta-lactamase superfamily)
MNITKYPQSCLLIEQKSSRILIDPGSFVYEKYSVTDLGKIDLILITHEHFDHLDTSLISELYKMQRPEIWANASVAKLIPNYISKIIDKDGCFNFKDIKIQTINIPHMALPTGEPEPENTAYIIDDILFHPGDGVGRPAGSINTMALPLAGPDISPKGVVDFVKLVKPKAVIPVHYDFWPAKPAMFGKLIEPLAKYYYLNDGESIEIEKI